MSFNIHSSLLLILALLDFGLGAWILGKYQRSRSILALGGLLFGLAALCVLLAAMSVTSDPAVRLGLGRLATLAGVWTFSLIYLFSVYYPSPSVGQVGFSRFVLPVALAFFIPLVYFGPNFLQSVSLHDGVPEAVTGTSYFIFSFYAAAIFLFGMVNLLAKVSRLQGAERRQTAIMSIALLGSGAIGLVTDVMMPALKLGHPPFIGLESSAAIVGVAAVIALKK